MDKEELTKWALKSGWQMIAGISASVSQFEAARFAS